MSLYNGIVILGNALVLSAYSHRVLRTFRFPGAAPLRVETISFLFELCSTSREDGERFVNEEGRCVADPNVLSDLLFGVPTSTRDRKVKIMYVKNETKTLFGWC